MTENKNIDVIVPVYNGENYIDHSILSILNQSYLPNQLIVIDDGSTDNTSARIKKIFSEYGGPVKTVYHYQFNKGLSSARNKGIDLADAPFLAFLDADDVWKKNKLEEQIKVFNQTDFKKLGLVYCAYEHIDEVGFPLYTIPVVPIYKEIRGNVFAEIQSFNLICGSGSAVLVKRECFSACGVFDEELKAFEDWDMWLRIAKKFEFDYSMDTLLEIRRHRTSMQENRQHMNEYALKFYKKWLKEINSPDALRNWAFNIGKFILLPEYSKERERRIREIFSPEDLRKLYKRFAGSLTLYLQFKKLKMKL